MKPAVDGIALAGSQQAFLGNGECRVSFPQFEDGGGSLPEIRLGTGVSQPDQCLPLLGVEGDEAQRPAPSKG